MLAALPVALVHQENHFKCAHTAAEGRACTLVIFAVQLPRTREVSFVSRVAFLGPPRPMEGALAPCMFVRFKLTLANLRQCTSTVYPVCAHRRGTWWRHWHNCHSVGLVARRQPEPHRAGSLRNLPVYVYRGVPG